MKYYKKNLQEEEEYLWRRPLCTNAVCQRSRKSEDLDSELEFMRDLEDSVLKYTQASKRMEYTENIITENIIAR